jgi:hypothetical protein
MADDLTGELVARLKVLHPEYADVPDDVLAASIFHTTNARDAGGAPSVAEALSPWTKAATIGAPGLGERYTRPTYGEVVSSENPARALLNVVGSYLVGAGRPRSVAAADPIGLEAWTQGKGPMPVFIGSTEEVGPSVGATIRAYHGSPHDFQQFSTAKIGTGEGAQAYGHGLYFAEQEGTAKAYRDALSNAMAREVVVDGVPHAINTESAQHMAWRDLAMNQVNVPAIRRGFTPRFADEYEAAAKTYAGRVTPANPGKMYEVNLKADPAHFLDWDKPLKEQPANVKAAANDLFRGRLGTREVGPDLVDVHEKGGGSLGVFPKDKVADVLANPADYYPYRGKEFYRQLESERAVDRGAWTNPSEYASQELAQIHGIPGIKYLDQGSRAAGEGSRNYVVFDDKLIDILRKYGLVPPIAGAAALGRTASDRAE